MLAHTTPTTLATVVGLADLLIDEGETAIAAMALAVVLHHPATRDATRDVAQDHWHSLEATLCPRVLHDAQARAATLTLNALLDILLARV